MFFVQNAIEYFCLYKCRTQTKCRFQRVFSDTLPSSHTSFLSRSSIKTSALAVGKHLCYICTVTVRQKLSVNLSAAYDKSIVTAVFSDNRFYIVNNLRAVTFKIFIGCKYNIFRFLSGFALWKLSNVFLPITTVLPIVFSLKNSIFLGYAGTANSYLCQCPTFHQPAAIIFILFHQEISIPVPYGSVLAQSMNDFDHSVNL